MSWPCPVCSGTNPDGTRFCGHCGIPRPPSLGDPDSQFTTRSGSRPALRDERRLVTALFADISGFSQLAGRLDAEHLQAVIDPVIAALSNVVDRYHGRIEKFAGDALMALFGAPVAHDDDAERALLAALDMQGELARLVPTLGADAAGLQLHVGVNSGHGVARVIGSDARIDYGVLGDVVVLAQRLEAAAPPGEIYVAGTTRGLAESSFEFERIADLDVKGRDGPVPAWRLLGRRRQRLRVDGARPPEIVGRDEEMAAILRVFDPADSADGAAVFVVGEAGVGKSALIEFARAASGWRDRRWLEARCPSYGAELPYFPIATLLRQAFGLTDTEPATAAVSLRTQLEACGLEAAYPFLGALLDLEGVPQTELTPHGFQRHMHQAVVDVIRAQAAEGGLVLVLDDLHWADGPTLLLAEELARGLEGAPVLLLVSSRPEAQDQVERLARAARRSLRLDLSLLTEPAVGRLAAGLLDGVPSDELVGALFDHTRGNPLFVEEVVRSLRDQGALARRGGEWRMVAGWDSWQVPLSVEGVLAARVDALPEDQRADLDVLAVIGRQVDLELARSLSPTIDRSLGPLVAAGLLDPMESSQPRHASFHHPLMQQVVYGRLLRGRRRELHQRVGAAAESLYGSDEASVDLLARHFLLGEDASRAHEYLLRAAARAERIFANEQAATCYRQAAALALAPGGPGEKAAIELLLQSARLDDVRGAYEQAAAGYRRVLEMDGDIRAAIGLASTLTTQGRVDEALQLVRETRAKAGELEVQESAALTLCEARALRLNRPPGEVIALLRSALATLGVVDPRLRSDLLVQLARHEELVGDHDAALEHAEEARGLLSGLDDLPALAAVLRVIGGIQGDGSADLASKEVARETLEEALALARRIGNAEESGACLINLGRIMGELGRLEDAVRCDERALAEFETVGIPSGAACALCNLAEHLGDMGRWREARDAAQRGLEKADRIRHAFWITGALIGIARSAMELGDFDEAAAAAERAGAVAREAGLRERERVALKAAAKASERRRPDSRG